MMGLKQKSARASVWALMSVIGQRGVSSAIYLVLARILSPADFGLIAMLSVVLVLSNAVNDIGLSDALINRKDADNADITSVFYFNVTTGFLLFLANWSIAPYVAEFYHEPQLLWLLRIISTNFIVGPIGSIQITLLRKELNFSVLAKVRVSSMIISGIAGFICAFNGAGVWSLAIQNVTQTFTQALLICIVQRWIPSRGIKFSALKEMISYGVTVMSANKLDCLVNSSYPMLIGKFYGKNTVGFYTNAYSLFSIGIIAISDVFYGVAFPAMSKLKADPVALSKAYFRFLHTICVVLFPIIVFLLFFADTLYALAFGAKWNGSIPYFRLLCVVGLFYPVFIISRSFLAASGNGKLTLYSSLTKTCCAILLLLFTCRISVVAVLYGMLASVIVSLLITLTYAKIISGAKILRELWQVTAVLIAAFAAVLPVYMMSQYCDFNLTIKLFTSVCAIALIYIALCRFVRFNGYIEAISLFSELSAIPIPMRKRVSRLLLR